ncbi:MAG: TolC family protein [Campylobacterales bacterium]|nr:TolC family protein [Campylobacterales bacterium]
MQIKARETLLKRDENMLVLEVLKAYNGAVAAKYFISALHKALEATKSHVELSTNFFHEGIVTNIDVLQAKDMEANVNAKLIEAKNRYNLAIAYLKFLLQDESIDGVDEFNTLNCSVGKLEELKNMAIKNRTDLEWVKLNEKSSQKMVDMEKSSNYPIIGLNAKYGFNDDKPTLSSDKDYYMVGVGLKYTVFDGGFSKAKIDQAKISHKQATLQRENLESFIKFEVEKNFRDLEAKKEILVEKIKSKELAEEILEKHQLMYKNSIINMTELLLKEADAQKARAEYIEAKYDEMIANANLAISLGYKMKEKR